MVIGQFIYTDLPRGKGFNPSSSGYQIQACSENLTAEQQEMLASICMHYGDAVYRFAPQSAIDQETAWRASTDNLDIVPAEVLKEFPQVWSYTRFQENLYALTRVRYLGLTHDRRPGNFLAHSLVFAPEALQDQSYNPLTAARSGVFTNLPAKGETRLAELSSWGLAQASAANQAGLLDESPYREHLPGMISALSVASPQGKPVLIRLADWHQALPVLEALLNLLPPSFRCRTTVCTYESDRNWLPTSRGQRLQGFTAYHHVIVLCGTDERLTT